MMHPWRNSSNAKDVLFSWNQATEMLIKIKIDLFQKGMQIKQSDHARDLSWKVLHSFVN